MTYNTCNARKLDLSCNMEIYHFKKLSQCAKQNIWINELWHFAKYLAKSFSTKIIQKYPPIINISSLKYRDKSNIFF